MAGHSGFRLFDMVNQGEQMLVCGGRSARSVVATQPAIPTVKCPAPFDDGFRHEM
jgi:hypothetical protein